MPYEITVAEVRDGFNTSASDADLTAYIAFAGQADACLEANAVPDAIGKQLKILAVRHLATAASDGGNVVSQRAVSGASRTFQQRRAGETQHLETLRMLDTYGCVMNVVSSGGSVRIMSVGRRNI